MARADQNYIIDLCDEVLKMKASREHTFDFLRGDPSTKFPQGKKLPVDAFYPSLYLVIEFEESHHSKSVKIFDKVDVMTVSGVNRAEQRIKYVELRKKILPKQNISLLFFQFDEFELKGKRLKRNRENDIEIVKKKLNPFIK
jgi:hypothetical protein